MIVAVGVSVSALPATLAVVPGDEAVCEVRVRNSGALVDQFTFQVLGAAAPWTEIVPPSLHLLPGTEGSVQLHVRPPRQPSTTAGAVALGLKVISTEDPEHSAVVQGVLSVAPFTELAGQLVPQTSRSWRFAEHRLTISSTSNHPVAVAVSAADPDELLSFDVPQSASVEPGAATSGTVRVTARRLLFKRRAEPRPFQLTVQPSTPDSSDAKPIQLGGTFVQRGLLSFWLLLLALAILVLVIVLFLAQEWKWLLALLAALAVLLVVANKRLRASVKSQLGAGAKPAP
jgi:hypothetical protein